MKFIKLFVFEMLIAEGFVLNKLILFVALLSLQNLTCLNFRQNSHMDLQHSFSLNELGSSQKNSARSFCICSRQDIRSFILSTSADACYGKKKKILCYFFYFKFDSQYFIIRFYIFHYTNLLAENRSFELAHLFAFLDSSSDFEFC